MNKKLIAGLIILVIVIIGVMIYFSRTQPKTISPVSDKPTVQNPAPVIDSEEYIDSSGFKFTYPENLKLEAKDVSTSNTLYADIIISSPDKKGTITIQVKDTTKTFFDELNKDKSSIETTLDDIDAFQYQENNQLITTAYDQGAQFMITADQSQEKNYWFAVNKQILNSFQFIEPEKPATSSQPAAGESDVIFEGEEVIE